MRQWKTGMALGVGVLAAGLTLAPSGARAQAVTYDHLTCVNVNKDDRFAQPPPPLRLDPEQAAFLESNGCRIVGGNSGNVTVNQQPPTRKLCVPAFPPGTPTPTPTAVATPTPTPIVSTPTPVVTPTPPYGSASRAFVKPVGSLLQ